MPLMPMPPMSDEMNALKIPEGNHHDARPLRCRPAAWSIRSTMSRAALGFPGCARLLESCSSSRGAPGWAGESRSENISEARAIGGQFIFDDQPRCLRFYHFLALRSW